LRSYASSVGAIEKEGRRWKVSPKLPRVMPIYSAGKLRKITVGNQATASLIGRYMAAVGRFLRTHDYQPLRAFVGMSVIDVNATAHPLETRPNVLLRLGQTENASFEQIYRIVI
jgi:hypothetical protein